MGAIRSYFFILFLFPCTALTAWGNSSVNKDTLTMLRWARVVTPIRYHLAHEELTLLRRSCREAATITELKYPHGPQTRSVQNHEATATANLSVQVQNNEQLVFELNEMNRKAQLLKFIHYHHTRLNQLLPPQPTLNKFFAIYDFGLSAPEIARKNILGELHQLSLFVKNEQFADCDQKIAALPKPLWGQL